MFCMNCGNEVQEGVKFCGSCGAPMAIVPAQQQAIVQEPVVQQAVIQPVVAQPVQQQSGVCCPNCGSYNVQVQIVEVGQQTNKKGVGFGGHMNNMARGMTAVATLGMSNLVWKKSMGTSKTKTVNATMAVCQQCGSSWEVKQGKFGSAPGSIFR